MNARVPIESLVLHEKPDHSKTTQVPRLPVRAHTCISPPNVLNIQITTCNRTAVPTINHGASGIAGRKY